MRPERLPPAPIDALPLISSAWAEEEAQAVRDVEELSRIQLALLARSAPYHLVRDLPMAMEDSLRHAKWSRAIAEYYGNAPARLPGPPCSSQSSEDLFRTVLRWGCVGSTLAAHEATAASGVCAGHLHDVWTSRAEDLSHRASVAWRIAEWLLAEDPDLRHAAPHAMHAALELQERPTPPPSPRHGLLSEDARREAQENAKRVAVLPLFRRLLVA